MCTNPRIIDNPKYKNNKSECKDKRKLKIQIPCEKCSQCLEKKAKYWQQRIDEEIKSNPNGTFITLTFNNGSLKKLRKLTEKKMIKKLENMKKDSNKTIGQINRYQNKIKKITDNDIATTAVRQFLERYTDKYKQSMRHYIITEKGPNSTERIHLHGIIWENNIKTDSELRKIWKYGITDVGSKGVMIGPSSGYITGYLNKVNTSHKTKILCSKGIGKKYTEKEINKRIHRWRDKDTQLYYTNSQGTKLPLSDYYKKKFYTEEQRDTLWTNQLNENKAKLNKTTNITISNRKDVNDITESIKYKQSIDYKDKFETKPETIQPYKEHLNKILTINQVNKDLNENNYK